jgi:hypothetical protein
MRSNSNAQLLISVWALALSPMKARLPNDVLRQSRSTGKFEEKLARLDENQGVTFALNSKT